jgi:hypothetical protein
MNKYFVFFIGINIFINPLTSSFYVIGIGRTMGLELLNEIGHIRNSKTNKLLNNNATNINFIYNLTTAAVFPWYFFHPLAIPYSLYFYITSTFNAINYYFYHKTSVQMGQFDI